MPAVLASAPLTRRHCIGLLGAAAVSGCGRRGILKVAGANTLVATDRVRVLVATSRRPVAAPVLFSAERDATTHFAQFDVSVPPDRRLGSIDYPRGHPDPQRQFLLADAARLESPHDFVRAVNAAAELLGDVRTGQMLVHGFNTNFAEGLMKAAQLYHDLKAPGIHMMFAWPSAAHLLSYAADREAALFSRDALAESLRLLRETELTHYNLVAHSMGTFLTMDTLRTMALAGERTALNKIGAVILISADLDFDVFRQQAEPVLAAGVPIYLIVSRDDRALRLSATIRGEQRRVGNIRSAEALGNIGVRVIDVSDIGSGDFNRHFKIGTSPELIMFIQRIRESGVAIFDDGQKIGLLDQGAIFVQSATGLVLEPLADGNLAQ